jgi:hypothetical protein
LTCFHFESPQISFWSKKGHRDAILARMVVHGWTATDSAYAYEHAMVGVIVSIVEDEDQAINMIDP